MLHCHPLAVLPPSGDLITAKGEESSSAKDYQCSKWMQQDMGAVCDALGVAFLGGFEKG